MGSIPISHNRGFAGRRGDPSKAPRCNALTRRGTKCQLPAERNPRTGKRVRCRLHGGLSTGAKTEEGKKRAAAAMFRHGRYSAAYKAAKLALREKLDALKRATQEMKT
jgi:hypothetical protein